MKNWKTTLAGIVGGLTIAIPQVIAWYEGQGGDYSKITIGAVIALLGILAKDFDKTNAAIPTDAKPVGNPPTYPLPPILTKVILFVLIPGFAFSLSGCGGTSVSIPPSLRAAMTNDAEDVGVAAAEAASSALQAQLANGGKVDPKAIGSAAANAAEAAATQAILTGTTGVSEP